MNVASASLLQQSAEATFFSLSDRLGRVRYFAYILLGMIGSGLLLVAIYLLALILPDSLGRLLSTASFILVKNILIPLIVFVMSIRRLHDLNRSGWWSFLVLIPFVTLILLLLPGNKTANQFGPPPPATPQSLVALCVIVPAALLAFYLYMVDVNEGFVRPGAPAVSVPNDPTSRSSPATPSRGLPTYQ
jgi:uncharacterized membrane protein YhaH (DUF805 family)